MKGRVAGGLLVAGIVIGLGIAYGQGGTPSSYTPVVTNEDFASLMSRFFKPRTINGRTAAADGPIKTFPLRGIKDSPPYLHDGRLLTLEDTVEFFNLVLGVKLTETEKKDLVTFLRAL